MDKKDEVSGNQQDNDEPIVKFSDDSASPTSGLPADALEALFSNPKFEKLLESKLQGTKDKRFKKLEEGESLMREVLTTLKENGATIPETLEKELLLKDYVDQRIRESVPSKKDNGMSDAKAEPQAKFNAISVIENLGLTTSDAEVMEFIKGLGTGKFKNPEDFTLQAAKLAISKAKPQTASDTMSQAIQGKPQNPKLSDEDIEKLAAKRNMLYLEPTKNREEIKRLNKQLEEAGVPLK